MGSPELMQRTLEKWGQWMAGLAEKGHISDRGVPLARSGKTVTGRGRSVTDGPYAEAKDIVGGFMLVEAPDLDHAVELSRQCPILETGGVVEVRPAISYRPPAA
jgi:hypothetical protein